jgi:hypothetical protein
MALIAFDLQMIVSGARHWISCTAHGAFTLQSD